MKKKSKSGYDQSFNQRMSVSSRIALIRAAREGLIADGRRELVPDDQMRSLFLALGKANGVQDRYDLSLAPDAGQVMGLTAEDLKTHLFLFGKTGKGMTNGGRNE